MKLTHLILMFNFYTFWKRQKNFGIEMEHLAKMG